MLAEVASKEGKLNGRICAATTQILVLLQRSALVLRRALWVETTVATSSLTAALIRPERFTCRSL